MTYKESYMQCKSYEDLEKEIKKDVTIAFYSPSRIEVIEKAASEVAKLKFGGDANVK